MRTVYLVNTGNADEPEYVAAETQEHVAILSNLVGNGEDPIEVSVYEAGDPAPELRQVFWASYTYDPSRDENRHPLHHRPGKLIVETGSESGLMHQIYGPGTDVYVGSVVNGHWYALSYGCTSIEQADELARLRFAQELRARGQTVAEERRVDSSPRRALVFPHRNSPEGTR